MSALDESAITIQEVMQLRDDLVRFLAHLAPKDDVLAFLDRLKPGKDEPAIYILGLLLASYLAHHGDSTRQQERPLKNYNRKQLRRECWGDTRDDSEASSAVFQALKRLRERIDLFYDRAAANGDPPKWRLSISKTPFHIEFRKNSFDDYWLKVPRGKLSRANTIGLFIPDTSEPVVASLIHGVEFAARHFGFRVVVAFGTNHAFQVEANQVTALSDQCAGLIILPALRKYVDRPKDRLQFYRALISKPCAFVFVERELKGVAAPVVQPDYLEAGEKAAIYLHRECAVSHSFVVLPQGRRYRDAAQGYLDYVSKFSGRSRASIVDDCFDLSDVTDQVFQSKEGRAVLDGPSRESSIGILTMTPNVGRQMVDYILQNVPPPSREHISVISIGKLRNRRLPTVACLVRGGGMVGQDAVRALKQVMGEVKKKRRVVGLSDYSVSSHVWWYHLPHGESGSLSTNALHFNDEDDEDYLRRLVVKNHTLSEDTDNHN